MTVQDLLAVFGAKYLFLAVIGIAAAYFLWQPGPVKRRMMMYAAVSWPLMLIIARLIAHFYYDPRPFVTGHFEPLIPHEPDNGFPSDHTLLSAATASLLFPFEKKLSSVAWLLTALVAFSRVYVGVHHPADVLGSIGIAMLTSVIIFRSIDGRLRQP